MFFQVLGAFLGWRILLYFGFGRFRCFGVSCVCFCFLCCFCFCFVCFVFVLLLDCFWCWFLFCFCFCFFFFVFLFFVLVVFVFVFFVFCCFVFLEGLRVRRGGPKGHLTWPQTLLIFLFLFFVWFCLVLFVLFVLFLLFVFCFLGRFKGQVRWPKGPPHLALNPPYFCFLLLFFVCFCFLIFLQNRKNCFPPKKAFVSF